MARRAWRDANTFHWLHRGGGTAVEAVCGDDDGAEKREGACRGLRRRVVVGALTKLARCWSKSVSEVS